MSWSLPRIILAAAALTLAACASEVLSNEGAGGASSVDPSCYDACIKKGAAADVCLAFCSNQGTGGGKGSTGAGASSSGSGKSSSSGSASTGSASGGTGGGVDPKIEKSCVECWYEEAAANGTCAAEATACEDSLACQQLQWCPLLCEKPDCVAECNDIIPSGVAPLAALVQCVACDNGPCADECVGSVMLSYCN